MGLCHILLTKIVIGRPATQGHTGMSARRRSRNLEGVSIALRGAERCSSRYSRIMQAVRWCRARSFCHRSSISFKRTYIRPLIKVKQSLGCSRFSKTEIRMYNKRNSSDSASLVRALVTPTSAHRG